MFCGPMYMAVVGKGLVKGETIVASCARIGGCLRVHVGPDAACLCDSPPAGMERGLEIALDLLEARQVSDMMLMVRGLSQEEAQHALVLLAALGRWFRSRAVSPAGAVR